MSQQDLMEFLDNHCRSGKWWNTQELSDAIGVSTGSTARSLKALRKANMVLYRQEGNDWGKFFYHSMKNWRG